MTKKRIPVHISITADTSIMPEGIADDEIQVWKQGIQSFLTALLNDQASFLPLVEIKDEGEGTTPKVKYTVKVS